jgi:hypothetical protein
MLGKMIDPLDSGDATARFVGRSTPKDISEIFAFDVARRRKHD